MADTKHQPAPRVDPHHGNNVASWTAVAVMVVGFIIAAVGVGMASVPVCVVGAVVIVAGAIAGKVMSGMGLGAYGKDH